MSLRAARADEAEDIAELASRTWVEPMTAEAFERDWASPTLDREADTRVAPGAYAAVWKEGGGKAWLELHGEPSAELLEWAEARALERGLRRAYTGAWSGENEPLLDALRRRGYRLVRHSYRMLVELGDVDEEPAWPHGVRVRTFEPGDEPTFHALHDETFTDSWEHEPVDEEEWRYFFLAPETLHPDLWFLALEGDEPAGIAICHPHETRESTGWVAILGVRRPWRRRGLGRALLLHAFAEFRRRGLARAGLGVDAESLTGAHRLYESVGMHVAHRFDLHEKALA